MKFISLAIKIALTSSILFACTKQSYTASPENLEEFNQTLYSFLPGNFQNEVTNHVKKGFTNNQTVFCGSSTITMWDSLETTFKNYNAANRGIGGAHIGDIIVHSELLIFKNNPKILVLYIGDNDMISLDYSRFITSTTYFIKNFFHRQPNSYLVLLSVKPSPQRAAFFETYKTVNNWYKSLSILDSRIYYVDFWDDFLKNPTHVFQSDNLHLNSNGYSIVTAKIKPVLDKIYSLN